MGGEWGIWASPALAIIGLLIALLSWRYPINPSVPDGGSSTRGKWGAWAAGLTLVIIGLLIAPLSWRYPSVSDDGRYPSVSEDGPNTRVSEDGPNTSSAADTITKLHSINVDFSVPREDLEEWLGNKFTPYPTIASELLALVEGRKLSDFVYIDVIVSNYEHTPGVNSPRTASDVRVDVLKAAVLEGYNKRHGTSESSFDAIVTY